ncbi:MAG: cobalamin-binding protein [Gammaproteobacteria bacterium]|nr:cobalamin-binding protein [Gammaproteobacteria bacterium]
MAGELRVTDDAGRTLTLAQPAQRIVSLAPHITELLFAAGAGGKIVGAVEYSDYPPPARAIPRVGNYNRLDIERLLTLKPDLVVGWAGGNLATDLERLGTLDIPLFISDPHRLDDVASDIERLGRLAGSTATAQRAAQAFRTRRAALQQRYNGRPPVRLFYQVWNQPLMTVNGEQVISDVIRLCGGVNVFAELKTLAPTINVEAVLEKNPEVIVASGMAEERPEWLDDWRRYPLLRAVQRDNLFFIPPDLLHRHTPRLLDGAEQMCRALDTARRRR